MDTVYIFSLSITHTHTHTHVGKRKLFIWLGGRGENLVLFSEYLIQPCSTLEIMGPFFRQKSFFSPKTGPFWVPFLKKWGPLKIWEHCISKDEFKL